MSEVLAQLMDYLPEDFTAQIVSGEWISSIPNLIGSAIDIITMLFETHWALGVAAILLAIGGFIFLFHLAAAAMLTYYAFSE